MSDGSGPDADSSLNDLNGGLVMNEIRRQIKGNQGYAERSLSTLKKHPPKDDLEALIRVKDCLRDVDAQTIALELGNDVSQAALEYFAKQGGDNKKMLEQVDNVKKIWADVIKQSPMTSNAIVPTTKTWGGVMEGQIEEYVNDMENKVKEFKKMDFWETSDC